MSKALNGGQVEEHSSRTEAADGSDESQFVSFEVAGQEYALPIEEVQEVVQRSEQITEVPNTPSRVLGAMTLRSRLLPLRRERLIREALPADLRTVAERDATPRRRRTVD